MVATVHLHTGTKSMEPEDIPLENERIIFKPAIFLSSKHVFFSVVLLFTNRFWVRKTWHHPKGNDGLLSAQGL